MFKSIPVEKIYSKSNVRKEQDDSILDLMGDIQKNGLLQPIVVRKDNNGNYEVVAGHRRLLAVRNLGEPFIECNILEDCSDRDRFILQLSENVQRRQMSAYELCMAFDQMQEKYHCSDIQISKMLHKSSHYVADQRYAVRLLEAQYGSDIPEDKKKLSAGVIKAGVKKKTAGKGEYTIGNGYTCNRKGHAYMINCSDFAFETALNEFLKGWKSE